jgi:hypothetical protein
MGTSRLGFLARRPPASGSGPHLVWEMLLRVGWPRAIGPRGATPRTQTLVSPRALSQWPRSASSAAAGRQGLQ